MSYQKLFLSVILAVLSICLSSCTLFRGTPEAPKQNPETPVLETSDAISDMRLSLIEQNRSFTYAYSPGKGVWIYKDENGELKGIEPEILKRVANKMGYSISFLEAIPDDLPGLLRSGWADIASGGISRTEIVDQLFLTPVMSYAPNHAENTPAFFIRNHAPHWKKRLEDAFSQVDISDILNKSLIQVDTSVKMTADVIPVSDEKGK